MLTNTDYSQVRGHFLTVAVPLEGTNTHTISSAPVVSANGCFTQFKGLTEKDEQSDRIRCQYSILRTSVSRSLQGTH